LTTSSKASSFVPELVGEHLQSGDDVLFDGFQRGDVHRGRDHVVARLAVVDVVVGVDRTAPQLGPVDLGRAVRDHLVCVHVRGGPGAGLEDVDRELVVVVARDDLLGRLDDRVRAVVLDEAELAVGRCGGFLDDPERPDEPSAEGVPRDREVLDRPLGLCAPVGVRRDRHLAQAVAFGAVFGVVVRHGGPLSRR